MKLLNATTMPAAYTMGMEPDGRELLVVVAKGTFGLPFNGETPQLLAEQIPLFDADVFTGEPGFSAPLYETDYAPKKPRCDIFLNGSAYVPDGRPAKRVTVSLQVGAISKTFDVVGNRYWTNILGTAVTPAEPFIKMPVSYNNAFGGIDKARPDQPRFYELNHAGMGFHHEAGRQFIEGAPLPNTEELGRPVNDPRGSYRPMAFGSLGRAWQPRIKLAGTYDQNWLENIFPFLPPDFDDHYYQATPPDQQMDYPQGGEEVVLTNLTPDGHLSFQLPQQKMPVVYYMREGENKESKAVIDTIVIEPDLQRLMMTWRSSIPLRKNMFEVGEVLIGEMPKAWHRARKLGKTYYPSLGVLATSKDGGQD
jgi:hypothetical protein